MAKRKKLNSMRLLEAKGIAYETHSYDPALRDAVAVAHAVGFDAGSVFKTLVVEIPGRKKPILALLPSNASLNLKRLAKALGAKKAAMAAHAAAEKLTGLQVGGISPLALTGKNWLVYIDARAAQRERVVISAGERGTQIRLATSALIELLGAELADIADPAGD